MGLLLSASELSKWYGTHVCFENVAFQIHDGQRIGLVGMNGCGKTSLMKILCEEEDYGGGVFPCSGLRVARMDQNPVFAEGMSATDAVLDAAKAIIETGKQIEIIHEQLGITSNENETNQLLAKLQTLEHRFELGGGHDLPRQAEAILDGLGLPAKRHAEPVSRLSGGERSRVELARLLLRCPDIWLLDEPTNHLDLDGIAFLESFLLARNATAMIISHDRAFLDRVTTHTWQIENKSLYCYDGNYSRSKDVREERRLAAWRAYEQQQNYLHKEEEYIRKYGAGQRAKQARGRGKRLARVERLNQPEQQDRVMAMRFEPVKRLGDRVLEIKKLCKSFGERKLFSNLSLELVAGETIGIVGANGTGKSTLIRILLEQMTADSGEFKWGQTAQPGVLWQDDNFPDETLTPFQYVQQRAGERKDQELRDLLAAMLFRSDDVFRPVHFMSGGEKKRLMLTRLLMEGHNILILDEPTNHLDAESCETLEMALAAFDGTLIVISHDRAFLDALADRILWISHDGWQLTTGDFSQALAKRNDLLEQTPKPHKQAKAEKPSADDPKPEASAQTNNSAAGTSPYSRWSVGKIENRIMSIEEQLQQLENDFIKPEIYQDGKKMKELQQLSQTLCKERDTLYSEYNTR